MAKKGFDRSANDRNKFWDDSVASRARTFIGSEYTGSLNAAASGLNAVGQLSAHNSVNPLDGIKTASSTDVRDWGGELIFDYDRYSASVGSLYEAMTGHSYHESFTTDIMTASLQYYYMNRSETQYSLMDVQYINGTGSFNYIPGIDPQKFGSNYSWRVVSQSGLTPWYSSYDEFNEDVRAQNQNYSVLPEWRISDNLEYYVDQKGGDFRAENTSSFYAVAEDLLTNDDVDKAIAGDSSQDKITIKCDVLKKLLPYNGFYPANRTVQIGELFSQSFGPHIYGLDSSTNFYGLKPSKQQAEQWKLQSLLQPFFAPGIMYNSVKSGIAVDWAAYTGSDALKQLNLQANYTSSLNFAIDVIDMAVDSEGNKHVAILDRDPSVELNNRVYYACDSASVASQWEWHLVDTYTGDPGQNPGVMILTDTNKKAHIFWAVRTGTNYGVRYINNTGSSWIKTEINSGSLQISEHFAATLDSNNKVHIAMYEQDLKDLRYANNTGSLWYSCSVDTTDEVGLFQSIVTDADNKPHISYRDATNLSLKYANWTGSNWYVEAVDSVDDVGYASSIAINSLGQLFIAYSEDTNCKVRMANKTGSSWILEDVASDLALQAYPKELVLKLDSDDKPYVFYKKEFNTSTSNEAKMFCCSNKTGSAWEDEKVENFAPSSYNVGFFDYDVKNDTFCFPVSYNMAYEWAPPSFIVFEKKNNNRWEASFQYYTKVLNAYGMPYGMDIGTNGTMHALAISYAATEFSEYSGYENYSFLHHYTKETSAGGSRRSQWTKDFVDVIDGGDEVGFGTYPRITLDSNDKPYVLYAKGNDIVVANKTGSKWIKDIVSSSYPYYNKGLYASLALHADVPYVAFYHNKNLKYANKTGTVWQVDDVVTLGDDVGKSNSIVLDSNGKPYISFYDKTRSLVKCINKTGSLWISESIAAMGGSDYAFTEIAFDNNSKPYVLFYSGSAAKMCCLANKTGSSWITEVAMSGTNGNIMIGPGNVLNFNSVTNEPCFSCAFVSQVVDDSALLYYVYKTGSIWAKQRVNPDSGYESWCAMKLDASNCPHVLYGSFLSGRIQHAAYNTYTKTFSIESVYPSGSNDIGMMLKQPNYRLPFESMLTPGQYIPLSSSTSANKLYFLAPSWYKQLDDTVPSDYWRYPYCVYDGKGNSVRYEMAINNFFGEVPRFFLRDNNLVSFNSKKESEFSVMNSGHTYYMDVSLFKTDDFQMFKSPLDVLYTSSVTQICPRMQSKSFGYDGQYFGPAVTAYGSTFNTTSLDYYYKVVSDPAYAAYTPPYFYGKATARLSFTVPHESRRYTLNEIFSNMRISYVNDDMCEKILTNAEIDPRTTGSILFDSAMPISASINVKGKARAREISFGTEGDKLPRSATDVASSDFDMWTIGTKWECPTLNFKHLSSSYDYDTISGSGFEGPRGMWLDYGKVPTNNQGIYVSVEESFKQRVGSTVGEYQNTGSLLEVCGFKPEARRVGELASVKEISEAIVMVPFSDVPISNMTVLIDGKNFFKVDKEIYDYQKLQKEKGEAAILAGKYGATEDVINTSISSMQSAMKRYYFPPRLDFSTYADIDPFVVYVFEFKHILDKEDLSLIWQNLMPKIARTVEKDSVEISHDMEIYEFFHGKALPQTGVRWMIFKVKRKAETSYYNVTSDSTDDNRFKFDFKVGGAREPEYTYNYPYDYFSLIECAKVEASVDYVAKDLQKISPETKKKVVEDARDLGSKAIEKELAKAVPVVVSSEPTVRTKQQEAEEFVFVSKVEKSDLLSKNIPSLTTERKKVVAKTGNAVDSTKSRVSTSARKTSAVKTPTTITKKTVDNKLTTRKK